MLRNTVQWSIPTGELVLAEQDVHVWCAPLNRSIAEICALQCILSADEMQRANRFYFEQDRQRWIVARGLLRSLLGWYTHVDPREIVFGYNDYGKPFLSYPPTKVVLHFNLSHSHDLAVYAFTYERNIGIDLEHLHTKVNVQEIANCCFSEREHTAFQALPLEKQTQAFFRAWTTKEAYSKALGMGLSVPQQLFDVAIQPHEPVGLLAHAANPVEMTRWTFKEFQLSGSYTGVLAVEGSDWQLSCWQFIASQRERNLQ